MIQHDQGLWNSWQIVPVSKPCSHRSLIKLQSRTPDSYGLITDKATVVLECSAVGVARKYPAGPVEAEELSSVLEESFSIEVEMCSGSKDKDFVEVWKVKGETRKAGELSALLLLAAEVLLVARTNVGNIVTEDAAPLLTAGTTLSISVDGVAAGTVDTLTGWTEEAPSISVLIDDTAAVLMLGAFPVLATTGVTVTVTPEGFPAVTGNVPTAVLLLAT